MFLCLPIVTCKRQQPLVNKSAETNASVEAPTATATPKAGTKPKNELAGRPKEYVTIRGIIEDLPSELPSERRCLPEERRRWSSGRRSSPSNAQGRKPAD